jgi:hypothetical protein
MPDTPAAARVNKTRKFETVAAPYPQTFPFENPGDSLEGVYKEVRAVSQDDLTNPGQKVDRNCYTITDDAGKDWSVWASAAIEEGMASVVVGNYVRIEFVDKIELDGGKSFKQFIVQVDRS